LKENYFFFVEKFGYAWGTHAKIPQEYKYPKSIWYRYGSIFGVPVLHRFCHSKWPRRVVAMVIIPFDT
jgi:hypothetical protein